VLHNPGWSCSACITISPRAGHKASLFIIVVITSDSLSTPLVFVSSLSPLVYATALYVFKPACTFLVGCQNPSILSRITRSKRYRLQSRVILEHPIPLTSRDHYFYRAHPPYTAHLFHPGSNQHFGPENPAGFHPKNLHISSLTMFLTAIANRMLNLLPFWFSQSEHIVSTRIDRIYASTTMSSALPSTADTV
jgi:hypothetical protein